MTQTIDDLVLSRTEAMRRLEEARVNLVVATGLLEAADEHALGVEVQLIRDTLVSVMGDLTDP
jgi:hypothetical protein